MLTYATDFNIHLIDESTEMAAILKLLIAGYRVEFHIARPTSQYSEVVYLISARWRLLNDSSSPLVKLCNWYIMSATNMFSFMVAGSAPHPLPHPPGRTLECRTSPRPFVAL